MKRLAERIPLLDSEESPHDLWEGMVEGAGALEDGKRRNRNQYDRRDLFGMPFQGSSANTETVLTPICPNRQMEDAPKGEPIPLTYQEPNTEQRDPYIP